MDRHEIMALVNIARFIVCLCFLFNMCGEAISLTPHCDINIAVSGIILIWIGTFRIWR